MTKRYEKYKTKTGKNFKKTVKNQKNHFYSDKARYFKYLKTNNFF